MGSEDDHLRMTTGERLTRFSSAKASARRLRSEGATASHVAGEQRVDLELAREIAESWPEAPKKTAGRVLDQYGPPHEITPTKMFWHRVRPWSRMQLTAEEVVHHFPTPHTDFFTQWVHYRLPVESASAVLAFDGSVLIDRAAGELGARCSHEGYNTLALNLAHEIATGRRDAADARRLYAEAATAFLLGRPSPYAEQLLFEPETADAGEPGEAGIGPALAHQAVEKVRDALRLPSGRAGDSDVDA